MNLFYRNLLISKLRLIELKTVQSKKLDLKEKQNKLFSLVILGYSYTAVHLLAYLKG